MYGSGFLSSVPIAILVATYCIYVSCYCSISPISIVPMSRLVAIATLVATYCISISCYCYRGTIIVSCQIISRYLRAREHLLHGLAEVNAHHLTEVRGRR